MKYGKRHAVDALAALAQNNRLDVFRLLVRAGPDGMAAGEVAEALELAPNTLTFHFDRLRQAGLVTVRRDGRSMIYAARYETMNGLLSFLARTAAPAFPSRPAARNRKRIQVQTGVRNMRQRDDRKVAVIGAGPVGLAAAVHLFERGITPIVLEAGRQVASSVRQWSHVRLFSPWEYNVDKASKRLLDSVGWNSPDPGYYPTGAELIENYLDPLATRTGLREHIRTSSYVTGISRVGFDKVKTAGRSSAPFEIHYRNGAGLKSVLADAVIDTSGT